MLTDRKSTRLNSTTLFRSVMTGGNGGAVQYTTVGATTISSTGMTIGAGATLLVAVLHVNRSEEHTPELHDPLPFCYDRGQRRSGPVHHSRRHDHFLDRHDDRRWRNAARCSVAC